MYVYVEAYLCYLEADTLSLIVNTKLSQVEDTMQIFVFYVSPDPK